MQQAYGDRFHAIAHEPGDNRADSLGIELLEFGALGV